MDKNAVTSILKSKKRGEDLMDLPLYTQAKVSPQGTVNKADLQKIARDAAIFLAAPILVYFGQLSGTLGQKGVVLIPDLAPTLGTIGAMEGWFIGVVINFFLKLNDSKK